MWPAPTEDTDLAATFRFRNSLLCNHVQHAPSGNTVTRLECASETADGCTRHTRPNEAPATEVSRGFIHLSAEIAIRRSKISRGRAGGTCVTFRFSRGALYLLNLQYL